MAKQPTKKAPLPTKDEVREFIEQSPTPVGKREIARAFHITGSDRIYLKKILKELVEDGVLARREKRRVAPPGALPSVAVIEVVGTDTDGEPIARPVKWDEETPPPKIILLPEKPGLRAPGLGDRLLAHLTRIEDKLYEAKTIRRLQATPGLVLGVFQKVDGGGRVQPTDRRLKKEIVVRAGDAHGTESGEVVLCEILPGRHLGLPEGRVKERLGSMGDPRSLSLIAVHRQGIPVEFPEEALEQAKSAKPVKGLGKRADLRPLPLVTIDPPDARDHDDAVWAAADGDPANEGGWKVIVAIADVAHYVTPGSALDRAARKRGNSVYFPDRVVPMLPEELSTDLCSLNEGADRPCLAVEMTFDADGNKLRHQFMRALMRSPASLNYRQVQEAWDGAPDEKTAPWLDEVIRPLFGAYAALADARDRREPLAIELPERRVEIGEDGFIKDVHPAERFEAHRLIEEFMIQANVAAAESLESRRTACMYRIHEEPDREKVVALADFLRDLGYSFAKGQVIRPKIFNRILGQAKESPDAAVINEVVLRSQCQAVYSDDNLGHFGLNLHRYAHFTSPIRRYSDLLVHRGLIRAFGLGKDGLTDEEVEQFPDIAEDISRMERRAMLAEREALDRFTAVFMSGQVGNNFWGHVSGVTRAGLFVRLDETGADGLIPISSLGTEYFDHDEDRHALVGRHTGKTFRLGDKVQVRLKEADRVTGSLLLSLLRDEGRESPPVPRRSGLSRKKEKKAAKKAVQKAQRKAARKASKPNKSTPDKGAPRRAAKQENPA